jgi:tol-pal system protein YbgF
MRRTGLLIAFALLCPAFAPAASKEIIELQRDVAQLQDQARQIQQTLDAKTAALQVLLQQTLDSANASSRALNDQGRSQQDLVDKVVSPIAAMNSKMEGVGNDMAALRESITDLTTRMNKMQQQLTDLTNAVKATQTPVAPPPSTGPTAGGLPATGGPTDNGSAGGAQPGGGSPPVKATTLYENALRDMQSGKADLALSEFQDYVKFYNNTDLAPNAQFYIGQIHYSQSQFDDAIKDFDTVLEAYPANNKTADAHYMKGKTLFQLGQRTAAAKEFESVVNDFPNSSVAPNARAQLKVLGIRPAAAASTAKPTRRR